MSQTLVSPVTGTQLTPEFQALGVQTGFDPPEPWTLGIIILSWSGDGKTTFVGSIPDCLLFDFGNNAGSIVAPRAHRIWIKTWDEYTQTRDLLLSQKAAGKCPYRMLAFDTGDEWFQPLAEHVVSEWNRKYKKQAEHIGEVGQEGKGYSAVGQLMAEELRTYREAGFGWIVTGHLRERLVRTMLGDKPIESTVIRPVLPASSFKPIVQKAHIKAQITVSITQYGDGTVKTADGQLVTTQVKLDKPKRVYSLRVRTNEVGDEVKARLPHLPDSIPFPRIDAWSVFVEAYRKAADEGREEHQRITAQTANPQSG